MRKTNNFLLYEKISLNLYFTFFTGEGAFISGWGSDFSLTLENGGVLEPMGAETIGNTYVVVGDLKLENGGIIIIDADTLDNYDRITATSGTFSFNSAIQLRQMGSFDLSTNSLNGVVTFSDVIVGNNATIYELGDESNVMGFDFTATRMNIQGQV